nr:RNA-directed DNA polymerase, eukaryota, nucleotide-binding alpha-beta plait domain protein [Tanacetum cinerariifolium]
MYDHKRGSSNSNEDLIKKISHSIYVTNFPDSMTSRDLRRECSNYGTVVDVFIPLKKSKAGRRFAFVRFIKVFNLDRLVENLCTIWIGRHHLYANKVRFERPQRSNDSPSNDTFKATDKHGSHLGGRQHSGHNRSYASAVNGGISRVQPTSLISPSPAMVLDDSCIIERDFSNHVMGKVNDFHSINDLHTLIKDKGFANVKILYLGGLWVTEHLMAQSGMDLKMAKIMMSSPNHPTSNIEDAFSSPNYTSSSPDYSPASTGNTPSESLNNSYGLVPIVSPTLSLFYDDPYMKTMHAYDNIMPPPVPIPPL